MMLKGCHNVLPLLLALLPGVTGAVVDPAMAAVDYPNNKRNLTYCFQGEVSDEVKSNTATAVGNWNGANTGWTLTPASEPCKGDIKIKEDPMGSGGSHEWRGARGVITSSTITVGTFASVRVIMHEFGHAMRMGHDPECGHKSAADCEADPNSPCHQPGPKNVMTAHQFSDSTRLTGRDTAEAKASAKVVKKEDKKVQAHPSDGQRNLVKPHVIEGDSLKLAGAEEVAVVPFFGENLTVPGMVHWDENAVYAPLMPLEPAHGQEWFEVIVWYPADRESAVFQGMLWVTDNPLPPGVLPHARAGNDTTVGFGRPVFLDGSGSFHDDPNVGLVHYCWRAESSGWYGPGRTVVLPPGRHEVVLTVYDEFGQQSSDTAVFTVELPAPGWHEVRSAPLAPSGLAVKHGGWLTINPMTGMVYAAKGNKTGDFYRYEPLKDSWYSLRKVGEGTPGPNEVGKGACGTCDGRNRVYIALGNNTKWFLRYDIAGNSWEALARVPGGPSDKNVKGGGDMVFVGSPDSGHVYLLKGYKTEFYRYSVASGEWEVLPEAPDGGTKRKYDKGSFLAYDGAGHIYAHQAKYTDPAKTRHHMFRFNLAARDWDETLPGMPLLGMHAGKMKYKKSRDGAGGVWQDGKLYALKGGNTCQFYRYTPEDSTWEELDTIPSFGTTLKKRRVKTGGDLVSYGYGVFYAFKGGKTTEFWRHVLPALDTSQHAGHRAGVLAATTERADWQVTIAPNPLALGRTTLRCVLPEAGHVRLAVHDVGGRLVRTLADSRLERGRHSFAWDRKDDAGRTVAAGVYVVRLMTDAGVLTRKAVLVR